MHTSPDVNVCFCASFQETLSNEIAEMPGNISVSVYYFSGSCKLEFVAGIHTMFEEFG